MEKLEIIKNIADAINSNEDLNTNYKDQIPIICDFAGELLELQKNFPEIEFDNFINNLKTLKFEDGIDPKKRAFAKYDINKNTIILYDIDRRESLDGEKKYHLFKSLLDVAISKRTEYHNSYGIVTKHGENTALNRALCENILSLMLNESRYNSLDLEMKILYQIEEILGNEIIISALFNSKYKLIEKAFKENYNIDFKNIYQRLDRLMNLNLGKEKENAYDSELINQIQRELINAYLISYAKKENIDTDITPFIENIIINDSIETKNKNGLSNVFINLPKNTDLVKLSIEGCKSGIISNSLSSKSL